VCVSLCVCVCVCVCVLSGARWDGIRGQGSVSLASEAGERACEGCEPLPPHHQHILCCEHAKELRASCPSTASAKPRGATILPGGGQAGWAAWTACTAGWMYGGRSSGTGPAEPVAYVARGPAGPRRGAPWGLRGGGLRGWGLSPPLLLSSISWLKTAPIYGAKNNTPSPGALGCSGGRGRPAAAGWQRRGEGRRLQGQSGPAVGC